MYGFFDLLGLTCFPFQKAGANLLSLSVSKQKQLKGSHQGQNATDLAVPESLEFKIFSCRPAMVADNAFLCSITPLL